jgi:hypothetical protein
MLGRALELGAGVARFGGCGRLVDALSGATPAVLWTFDDGGFASFGGSGNPPTALARVPRGGLGGGVREGCCGRDGFDI